MSGTPRSLLAALDQITANLIAPEAAASAEMLGNVSPLAFRQLNRTRTVFDDDNVVGAGIAEKLSSGEQTGELGIVFYVRSKMDRQDVAPEALIPPVVAGQGGRAIFTDVVEVGDVVPELNAAAPPLRSGFSISHKDGTAGTLGAFVKRRRQRFMLSNSHVFAESGTATIGDAILYPGPADGGTSPASEVGRLESFTPFSIGNSFTNTVDAALATINPGLLATLVADLHQASTPLKVGTPARGMRVVKRGRTTGDTESVVRDTNFRILVNYPVGTVGFTGQVRCDRYTQGGDSGSIVIDKDTGRIVGLHFSGSPSTSVFTPIKTVMQALSFSF